MSSILLPLSAVFGIMLLGTFVQKLKLLPSETDAALNQYVYYIAFPAIMFITLAETDIDIILNWGLIAGLSLAMVLSYLFCLAISLALSFSYNSQSRAIGAIRSLNATFGNTAFIGIPLMMLLFPGQQSALAAAAVASFLSILMFALALVSLECALTSGSKPVVYVVLVTLAKNPIVMASLIGLLFSALKLSLFDPFAIIAHQVGMTSSPCALFAIGMVLAKATRNDSSLNFGLATFVELISLNFIKLILQPLLAYFLLSYFGVTGEVLLMGVLLAGLPTAASVYLLAQRYRVKDMVSAQGILLGTLLTFASLPMIQQWMR